MTVRTTFPTIDPIFNQPILPEVISFWCDDIEETVRTVQERDVVFESPVQDRGLGWFRDFQLPRGVEVLPHQPNHGQP